MAVGRDRWRGDHRLGLQADPTNVSHGPQAEPWPWLRSRRSAVIPSERTSSASAARWLSKPAGGCDDIMRGRPPSAGGRAAFPSTVRASRGLLTRRRRNQLRLRPGRNFADGRDGGGVQAGFVSFDPGELRCQHVMERLPTRRRIKLCHARDDSAAPARAECLSTRRRFQRCRRRP
jgi:hypothetical protein